VAADYKLYLTYRTEYLLLGDLCVGVRDRRSSAWLPLHAAACAQLSGAIRARDAALLPGVCPRPGERLSLLAPARQVVTGPVVAVEHASSSLLEQAELAFRGLFEPDDPHHTRLLLMRE
jgi:hypothetical protein